MLRREAWLRILAPVLGGLLVAACAAGGNTPPGDDDDDDTPSIDAPPSGECNPPCSVGSECCYLGSAYYCVNTASDRNNCGGCGVTCLAETGDLCSGGSCHCEFEPACTGSEVCCETGCKDLQNDSNNCGGCGIPCGPGLTCSGGVCTCGGVQCNAGESCCSNTCVNTATDANNCGQCGKVCADPTTECNSSTCTCPGGGTPCPTSGLFGPPVLACCSTGCVDICGDGYNCGACGVACPESIPGFPGTCMLGSCDGAMNPACLPF